MVHVSLYNQNRWHFSVHKKKMYKMEIPLVHISVLNKCYLTFGSVKEETAHKITNVHKECSSESSEPFQASVLEGGHCLKLLIPDTLHQHRETVAALCGFGLLKKHACDWNTHICSRRGNLTSYRNRPFQSSSFFWPPQGQCDLGPHKRPCAGSKTCVF